MHSVQARRRITVFFFSFLLLLLLIVGLDVAASHADVARIYTCSKPAPAHVMHIFTRLMARVAHHLKLHKLSPKDSGVSAMLRNMSVFAPSPPRLQKRS